MLLVIPDHPCMMGATTGRTKLAWHEGTPGENVKTTAMEASAEVVPISCHEDNDAAVEAEALQKFREAAEKKRTGKGGTKLDHIISKVCVFSIMDVIEDQVYLRNLNVWSFVLIYIFFVLSLLRLSKRVDPEMKTLTFVADPPNAITAGPHDPSSLLTSDLRRAKCTVQNANGSPRKGVHVRPHIIEFLPTNKHLPCSTERLRHAANTLVSYQFKGICEATIKGNGSSDELGLGQIDGFEINGPAGVYKVRLEATTDNVDGPPTVVQSDIAYNSNVYSAVTHLEVVYASNFSKVLRAPEAVAIGQPFLDQPAVILKDALGQPVEGIPVNVFSNPDASWPPDETWTPVWLRRGQKLAELDGSISRPSDANGVAVFDALTVIGSTFTHTNLIFVVNGQTFLPWNDNYYSFSSIYPELISANIYRESTEVLTAVRFVEIHQIPQNREVVEGASFSVEVKATDENGAPVAGSLCYALLSREYGNLLPLLFRRQLKGIRSKEILNPRSSPTDARGIAAFADLKFSGYGNARTPITNLLENPSNEFELTFYCDGHPSPPVSFNVTSNVATVKIKRFLRSEAYVESPSAPLATDGSDLFVAVVRITDSSGKGVAGKNVRVYPTGDFAGIPLFPAWSATEPSSDSGFSVVSFRVPSGSKAMATAFAPGFLQVYFSVDGVNSEVSTSLTLRLRQPPMPEICQNIIFHDFFALGYNAQVKIGSTVLSYVDIPSWPVKNGDVGQVVGIVGNNYSIWYNGVIGVQAREDFEVLNSYNIFEDRPIIQSGQTTYVGMVLLAAVDGMLVHFPAGNYSNGFSTSQNYSSGGRRLVDVDKGEQRRLALERFRVYSESGDFSSSVKGRRLSGSGSLGTIRLETRQAYSTTGKEMCRYDGSCEMNVPHEPPLIMGQFLPQVGGTPTIEDLNLNPGYIQTAIQYQGPPGTHRVQIKATLEVTGLPTSTCYSPPMAVEIENAVAGLLAYDQKSLADYTTYLSNSYSVSDEVEFSVFVDSGTASLPTNMVLSKDLFDNPQNQGYSFYHRIEDFPLNWANTFMNHIHQYDGGHSIDNSIYTLRQIGAYGTVTRDGKVYGVIKVGLKFKPAGIFGEFAIVFGSSGIISNVVRFRIAEPPLLSIEIIQPPSFGWYAQTGLPWYTQKVLPQQPIIKVLSNGQPLDGVIVLSEVVPAETGALENNAFQSLLGFSNYDVMDVMYSKPSGYSDKNLNGGPNASIEGKAFFEWFMLVDGIGCMKFRFWAGTRVFTELSPASPLCFRPIAEFKVVSSPPATVPIGMSFGSLAAISNTPSKFTVQMQYADASHLLLSGIALARISIVKYNTLNFLQQNELGIDVARTSSLLSREMLIKSVCVWIGLKEYSLRCSDLKIVQLSPFPLVQFDVEATTWLRMQAPSDTIRLMVTDISLSPLQKHDTRTHLPANFASLTHEEKHALCLAAATTSYNEQAITHAMTPELTPQSAKEVVSAPAIVEVGSMFLTRIMVLSQSGAPLPNIHVRVAIISTLQINPGIVSGDMLQSMAKLGKNLKSFADPEIQLEETGSVKESNSDGMVSFPLTIERATSGTYKLKFEAVGPPETILLTSQSFTVVNPISAIAQAGDGWGDLEIDPDDFRREVPIPKKLQFKVSTSGGYSLEQLRDEKGIKLSIRLVLKGMSKKTREALAKVKAQSTRAAADASKAVSSMSKSSITQSVVGQAATQAAQHIFDESPFARLDPQLLAACRTTSLKTLEEYYNATHVRDPMLAQAISSDPDAISPGDTTAQFVRVLTGSGAAMATSESMVPQLTLDDITLSDLQFVSGSNDANGGYTGIYEVTRPINFKFLEDSEYVWSVSINGLKPLENAFDTFVAVKKKMTPAEWALNWVITCYAGVLAVIVLSANSVLNDWRWIFLGIPSAIAVTCIAPSLKGSKEAIGGHWAYFACVNTIIITICLIWVACLRLKPLAEEKFKGSPPTVAHSHSDMVTGVESPTRSTSWLVASDLTKSFATTRLEYFERYSERRMLRCLQRSYEPHACKLGFKQSVKQMFRPFDAEHAFYYPSQVLVALLLSFFTYMYCLVKAIDFATSVDESLMGLLDKTINACIRLIMQMESQFAAITRVQLPDSATVFVLDQLKLVQKWFTTLVDAIQLGMIIGIVVAAIAILASQFQLAFCFRSQVLKARCGIKTWKVADAAIVYDACFMGQSIATTIVSFAVIVLLVVLIVLPFAWPVLWNIIWSLKWYFLTLGLLMTILQKVLLIIAKKIMFSATRVKNRPAASVYMFWQTWISIVAGFSTAIFRFVMAIIGVIVGMPQLPYACTSPQLNSIYLLDAVHKSYLAAVAMHHNHNNPIVFTAIRIMRRFAKRRRDMLEAMKDDLEDGKLEALKESVRKRNQRWVILLLLKFPWLAKHRKAHLQEKAEEAHLEKVRKKMRSKRMFALKNSGVKDMPAPPEELKLNQALVTFRMKAEHHEVNVKSLEKMLQELQYAETEEIRKPIEEAAQKMLASLKVGSEILSPRPSGQLASPRSIETVPSSSANAEKVQPAPLNVEAPALVAQKIEDVMTDLTVKNIWDDGARS